MGPLRTETTIHLSVPSSPSPEPTWFVILEPFHQKQIPQNHMPAIQQRNPRRVEADQGILSLQIILWHACQKLGQSGVSEKYRDALKSM